MERGSHKQGSLMKNANVETSVHRHSNKKVKKYFGPIRVREGEREREGAGHVARMSSTRLGKITSEWTTGKGNTSKRKTQKEMKRQHQGSYVM